MRPELRASLARDLGDRLTTVELDCGHMVYWDAFEETAAALRGFLSALTIGRRRSCSYIKAEDPTSKAASRSGARPSAA